jgi:site-specific DNA recombinase
MEEIIDYTKLKYALYARKSTTDESRQIRSIDDQLVECKELANRLGIHIREQDIYTETKSAKRPNQRPIFKQLLQDIKKGVYDGILAWNPDRLARNMLEGGQIIDMIDEGQIKDLKFVTHHFTKDANGKMLLGMAFVLSKQYSDDLSQKVTRGVRRSFAEGKSPIPKHGYTKNENGQYNPDDKNFELISKAWQMRAEGTSLEDIANDLNKNDYGRKTKTGKIIKMTKQILTDVFKDPIYYGILVQADSSVNLIELYDFQPIISEDHYIQVQQLTGRRIKPYKQKNFTFLPLKSMVICSICSHYMYPGASKGNNKRYLFYRCDNKYCNRQKKSIRAKIVFNYIYDFLEKGINFSEAEYSQYLKNINQLTDEKRQKIRIEIHSREGKLKGTEREIKEIALGLLKQNINSTVRKVNEERLTELEA